MNLASDSAGVSERLTFSFGRNWKSFSRFVSADVLDEARADITDWLGPDGITGKRVIDIGCGSGIHSLSIYRMGPKELLSVDLDPHSVACTRGFWAKVEKPPNWRVERLDILDRDSLSALGQFDVVYTWGVLHHTGKIWTAVENASSLAKAQGCRLWLSLYAKGPDYEHILRVKRRFNNWPWPMKQAYVWRYLFLRWHAARRNGLKIRDWFWHGRGMNAYHDAVDWFGGLPYEEASVEEVTAFLAERGWKLERVKEASEGACSVYLFRR